MLKLPLSDPKATLSIQEAASFLGLSTKTLRRWEASGVLTAVRTPGGHRRYNKENLERVKASLAKKAEQPSASIRPKEVDYSAFSTPKSINIPPQKQISVIKDQIQIANQNIVPVLYRSLHLDQKKVLAGALAFGVFFAIAVGLIKANGNFRIADKLGFIRNIPLVSNFIPNLNQFGESITEGGNIRGQVLQAAAGIPSFNINVVSTFAENSTFNKDVEIKGNLTLDNILIVPALQATTTVTAGTNITAGGDLAVNGGDITTTQTTFNLLTNATTLSIAGTSGTTTINNNLAVKGTETVTGKLTASGDLAVSGSTTLGTTTAGATTVSSLTDSGALTVSGTSTLSTLVLSDTKTLNIGGVSGLAYNAMANSGQTPSNAAISSDNDLYIGGDLEVTGTIYGSVSGTFNPSLTTGSVLFQGPSGIAADNANFFWDDTNNFLGIGTSAAPNSPLHVNGSLSTSGAKLGNFVFQNTNTAAGLSVNGISVTATGSTPSSGTNTENLINLSATALGSNTFNGVNFGSGLSNYINSTNWSVTAAGAETIASDLGVNGGNITTSVTGTAALFNTNATTLNIGGAATTIGIGAGTGTTTINNDLAVNGGDITTNQTTATLFNATATTLSLGGGATTALNIGNGNTAYTAINLGSGTGGNVINIAGTGATGADTVNIGTGGTSADTITIGNSASTTTINLTRGSSGNIVLTGMACNGFLNLGKLTTDVNGNLQCANDVSAAGSGTNFWQQNAEVLTPFNATLDVALGGTATSSAKFQAYGIETAAGKIASLTSNTIQSGDVLYATASAITSGNMIKLGQGGDTNFTGNGLYMDFDRTGQGGIGFTGNFLKFDNATSTKFSVSSTGLLTTIGGMNVSGASSTIDTTSNNLTLNLGSDAVGDIYYRASSGFLTRIPIGSSGQSLTVGASSVPTWVGGSGASGADGWWQRSTGVVAPANITDDLTIGGIATASAKFQAYGVEKANDATSYLASLTSSTINTGSVLYATSSAITSGSMIKLGEGGDQTFSGSGILMDFDNTGGGGSAFTGNFLLFKKAGSSVFTVNKNGAVLVGAGSAGIDTLTAGTLNVGSAIANAITIGQSGVTTTNAGALTSSQTLTASSGFTLTTGALSMTSTTVPTFSLTSTNTSGNVFAYVDNSLDTASAALQSLTFKNNNTAAAGLAVNGLSITSTGSTPLSGTNTENLINLSATALGSNTFNGINFGSGLTNYVNGTNWTVTAAGAETLASDLAVNGGNITTTSTGTAAVFNTNATTLNIGGAASTVINLGPTSNVGSIVMSGGSADTGCTLDGTTGNLTCSGSISTTGSSGTQGFFQLNSKVLAPVNTTYDLTIGGTATASAKFQAYGVEDTSLTSHIASFTSSTITQGSVLYATSSAITSGNMISLGEGGDQTFSGNGLYMDFDKTGGGGLAFTGNFLKFDNATSTKFTVSSAGTVAAAGVYTGTSGTNLRLQATGTTGGSTGNSSIYFLNSSGTTTGRVDTVETTSDFGTGGDGSLSTGALNMNTTDSAASIDLNGTYADGIAYKVDMTQAAGNLPNTGNTAILTVDTPSGLVVGDEVLLMNYVGSSGDVADVGNYEFLKIASISTKTITFSSAINRHYSGTTATNQSVILQRIPQYTSVTLSGAMTASAWDGLTTTPTGAAGYLTGIVAFRATGTVSIPSGASITVNGLGYRGGTAPAGNLNAGNDGGQNGESFDGYNGRGGDDTTSGAGGGNNGTNGGGSSTGTTTVTAAGTRGGGGGGGNSDAANSSQGGGGGGGGGYGRGAPGGGGGGQGNASNGGTSGADQNNGELGGGGGGSGCQGASGAAGGRAGVDGSTCNSATAAVFGSPGTSTGQGGVGGNSTSAVEGAGGGGGGGMYGSPDLSKIFPGSGGGSGGSTDSGPRAGNVGGAGGGIVFVAANAVSVGLTGGITSTGTAGTGGATIIAGAGGGGAGGSVYILANSAALGNAVVTAAGGAGGAGGSGGAGKTGGAGGDGTVGRIRVELTSGSTQAQITSPVASVGFTIGQYAKSAVGGTYGTLHIGKVDTVNADLAEYYSTGDSSIEAGDVVSVGADSVNNSKGILYKSESPYDSKLLGIISTDPGLVLGSKDEDGGRPDERILALSGRVPVKIASDSAEIHAGDYLTSSTTPGRATKALKAGYTVAKALEDWSPSSGKDSIMSFVNLGYYMGPMTGDGYIDTGENFIANSVKVTTTQSLIDRIFGIRSSTQETENATDSGTLDQTASDSASLNITEALSKFVDRIESVENDVTLLKSQELIATGSAGVNIASSSGQLTVNDLVVLNGANVGTLQLTNGAIDAIGTLKIQPLALGAIQLAGNTIEIDTKGNLNIKNGVVIGNSSFRDAATISPGQTSINVSKTWDSPPLTVTVTADYDTYAWIENISKDGFTVKVKNSPLSDQKVYWQAIW